MTLKCIFSYCCIAKVCVWESDSVVFLLWKKNKSNRNKSLVSKQCLLWLLHQKLCVAPKAILTWNFIYCSWLRTPEQFLDLTWFSVWISACLTNCRRSFPLVCRVPLCSLQICVLNNKWIHCDCSSRPLWEILHQTQMWSFLFELLLSLLRDISTRNDKPIRQRWH